MPDLYVARSHRGRIMRTVTALEVGDVVHTSHVLVIPCEEVGPRLDQYVFAWTETHAAVAFGYGSIFSHSRNSNVRVVKRIERETIDYGYEPEGYDGQ